MLYLMVFHQLVPKFFLAFPEVRFSAPHCSSFLLMICLNTVNSPFASLRTTASCITRLAVVTIQSYYNRILIHSTAGSNSGSWSSTKENASSEILQESAYVLITHATYTIQHYKPSNLPLTLVSKSQIT